MGLDFKLDSYNPNGKKGALKYIILIEFFFQESSRKSEALQRKKNWQHSIFNVQFMHGIELFHEII